jgi:starvation-inducible DNA-binding protein
MLRFLRPDNAQLLAFLRHSHEVCARWNDASTTSLIEVWIEQTEGRVLFLNATLS